LIEARPVFTPLRKNVKRQVTSIPFLRGIRFLRKLDAQVMRNKLFQVHGSERRSVVNVYPELCNRLLRVLALRELDDRAYDFSERPVPTRLVSSGPLRPDMTE
jgi:hypothetical protein